MTSSVLRITRPSHGGSVFSQHSDLFPSSPDNKTLDAMPRPADRSPVDDDLQLGTPIDKLKSSEASRNKEILLHYFHWIRNEGKGVWTTQDAVKQVVKSIWFSWRGSNIALGSHVTLERRVEFLVTLHR